METRYTSTSSMKIALKDKEPDSSKPPSKEDMQDASFSQFDKMIAIEKQENSWCYYLLPCLFGSPERDDWSVAETLTPEQRVAMGF